MDEKFPGVLAASDNRSHTPPQGKGFSPSLSVKERSALYLSRVAAAAVCSTNRRTEWLSHSFNRARMGISEPVAEKAPEKVETYIHKEQMANV
ncbi:hypothetical protein L345_09181, partial [Ophiophagus hannah]